MSKIAAVEVIPVAAPGQAHGNNVTDHFGGTSFTWHAITASGTPARTGQAGNPGGYSYQGGLPGY